MTPKERRLELETLFADTAEDFAQFGQPASETRSTAGGATGCSQARLAQMVFAWTGKRVTQDDISRACGYWASGPADKGMSGPQVDKVLASFRLPYVASYHLPLAMRNKQLSTPGLLDTLRTKGPVIHAVFYRYYPQSGSLSGSGFPAPNGYASKGGRNDKLFESGHCVVAFGARYQFETYKIDMTDPDHGSKARPYVPDFDRISLAQYDVLWKSGRELFGAPVLWLPQKVWNGQGTIKLP